MNVLPLPGDGVGEHLVYACSGEGKPWVIERTESRNGMHTIEAAAARAAAPENTTRW